MAHATDATMTGVKRAGNEVDLEEDPRGEKEGRSDGGPRIPQDLEDALTAVLDKQMKKFHKLNSESNKELADAILLRMESRMDEKFVEYSRLHSAETDALRKLVMEHGQQIKDLQRARTNSPDSAASNATRASTATSTLSRARNLDAGARFRPTKLEVKGWVRDWDRLEQEGLLGEEVKTWIDKLEKALSPELRGGIDWESSSRVGGRVFYSKMFLQLSNSTGSPNSHSLKSGILDCVQSSQELWINGSAPKIQLESPPWKKPFIEKGGRLFGALRRCGVHAEGLLTEWGPVQLKICAQGPEGSRPLPAATWDEKRGWDFKEDGLRLLDEKLTAASLRDAIAQ